MSTWPTIPARRCFSTTTATGRSKTSACRRAWHSRPTAGPRPAWASVPATTTATDGSTSSRPTSTTTRRRSIATWVAETFEDATLEAGLGVNTRYLGWGTGFLDFDLDSWPDIFIVNGHVYPEADRIGGHYSYAQRKLLYRNLGNGRFEDVSLRAGPGIAREEGRLAAQPSATSSTPADRTSSSTTCTTRRRLLHNCAPPGGHSLVVQLVGTRSNRSAHRRARHGPPGGRAGSIDEVRSGGSFCSQNDLRIHVGLGARSRADRVEVDVAERCHGDGRRGRCGSDRGHSGGQRRRPAKTVGPARRQRMWDGLVALALRRAPIGLPISWPETARPVVVALHEWG